jgi:hypothetical protein
MAETCPPLVASHYPGRLKNTRYFGGFAQGGGRGSGGFFDWRSVNLQADVFLARMSGRDERYQ